MLIFSQFFFSIYPVLSKYVSFSLIMTQYMNEVKVLNYLND